MTDEEKIKRLKRLIRQEKRKRRPDKRKIKRWCWEIEKTEENWRNFTEKSYEMGLSNRPALWKPHPRLFKPRPRPARPPHNKDDEERIRALYLAILGFESAKPEITLNGILKQRVRIIEWAREGRFKHTKALRLGIIAGETVNLVREFKEFKIRHQEIYRQYDKYIARMRGRPIITAVLANPEWRARLSEDGSEPPRESLNGRLGRCVRMILWAREGRDISTQAQRLGIIAGTPVKELAHELKISTQAIYRQLDKYSAKMGGLA